MTLEYLVLEKRRVIYSSDKSFNFDFYCEPTHYIEIKGQRVACHGIFNNGGDKITGFVVPGMVVGEQYQTEQGVLAIQVEPIIDKETKGLVCKVLNSDQQYVTFWDNGEATRRVLAGCSQQ